MVKQYPHTILLTVPASATQDGNGNWVSSGSPLATELTCRHEVASGRSIHTAYVIGADGAQIAVQAIVYLPLPVSEIKVGTKVLVKEGENVLIDSTVKQFSKGQLNARIWL